MKKFLSLVVGLISLLAAAGAAFGGSTARYFNGVKARAVMLQNTGGDKTMSSSGKKGHKIIKSHHKGHKGGKKSKKGSTTTTPPPK